MKARIISLTIFFALVMSFFVTSNAVAQDIPGGWAICEIVRIGTNQEHGWAYLELTSEQKNWGRSVIFAIHQDIRSEALAVALTALSMGERIRVLIRADKNPRDYQILRAVYTYTP